MSKTIDEIVADLQRNADEANADLAAALFVRDQYPDAERIHLSFRRGYRDAWASRRAHDLVDQIDATSLIRVAWETSEGGGHFVAHVLYAEFETVSGKACIYSSRRVDILAAFEAYNANRGARSLVDCMKDTCDAADAAHATWLREQAELKAAAEAKKSAAAQPS